MIITHESNYGREYRVRIVLNADDIDGIAERMHTCSEKLEGHEVASFIRSAMTQVLWSDAPPSSK